MAVIAGVSGSVWGRYETGEIEPGAEVLVKLAKGIPGLDVRWLLVGEGEIFGPGQSATLVDLDRVGFQQIHDEYFRRGTKIIERWNEQIAPIAGKKLSIDDLMQTPFLIDLNKKPAGGKDNDPGV